MRILGAPHKLYLIGIGVVGILPLFRESARKALGLINLSFLLAAQTGKLIVILVEQSLEFIAVAEASGRALPV